MESITMKLYNLVFMWSAEDLMGSEANIFLTLESAHEHMQKNYHDTLKSHMLDPNENEAYDDGESLAAIYEREAFVEARSDGSSAQYYWDIYETTLRISQEA